MLSDLQLYDDTDSAWMIAFLGMPITAREAWRDLSDRVGVDRRCPLRPDFRKLVEHHRLFPADPAMEEIQAMGREEIERRSN